jgi:hypothetical protein
MRGPDVGVGERWAYREKSGASAVEVEVRRIGKSRPPRVRVRFVDDEFEGREEWVPEARLKVQWKDVVGWQAREDRWDAVRRVSAHVHDTPEYWAVNLVFCGLPDESLVDYGSNGDAGILIVPDVDALTKEVGIDPQLLIDDALSFVDDNGSLVSPWPVALQLARHVALRFGDDIIAIVVEEEAKHRHDAMHGRYGPGRRGGW